MKKVVKETLNERIGNQDYYDAPKLSREQNVLAEIKKRCEDVIQGAEEYFQSLEDEGMDPDDLDSDEIENYASNASASDFANQILDIINK